MANTKSSRKRARQNVRRATINQQRSTQIRTAMKKVRSAVSTKNLKGAKEALKSAIPLIDRAAKVGIIKPKTASRNISRLTIAVNQLST